MMLQEHTNRVLICTLLVAMVTAVPVANQENVEGIVQPVESSVKGKRADELFLSNVQNLPHKFAKRTQSEPEVLTSPDTSDEALRGMEGEVDQGAKVTVHEATPVEEDLAARAALARKDFEDQGKISDAMEAAMQSVVKVAAERKEGEDNQGEGTVVPDTNSGEIIPDEQSEPADDSQAVPEGDILPNDGVTSLGHGESSESSDEENSSVAGSDDEVGVEGEVEEDEDIQDLLQATGAGQESTEDNRLTEDQASEPDQAEIKEQDTGSSVDSNGEEQQKNSDPITEAQLVPNNLQTQDGPESINNLLDFLNPQTYRNLGPEYYWRGRRSLHNKQRAARRIKRDLLDDVEYDPELVRYLFDDSNEEIDRENLDRKYPAPSSEDFSDALISDADDNVPATAVDASELYEELRDFLQWDIQRREETERLKELLGIADLEAGEKEDAADLADEDIERYLVESDKDLSEREMQEKEAEQAAEEAAEEQDYLEKVSPMLSALGVSYPVPGRYDYSSASKRGGSRASRSSLLESRDYQFPVVATRKRYFFPFADEPETHWGAFVPEKRSGLLGYSSRDQSIYRDAEPYRGKPRYREEPRYSEEPSYREEPSFREEPSYREEASYNRRASSTALTKRDYNKAIQRLQRLAMALSDNSGPYFSEIVQDQRYKK